MTQYSMTGGSILIVAGYTDQELQKLEKKNKTTSSTDSNETQSNDKLKEQKAKDSSSSSNTNADEEDEEAVNEKESSSPEENIEEPDLESDDISDSDSEVKEPPSMYFSCREIAVTPHIPSYEEFNSAEGLILLEKACDRFAEIEIQVLVHQALSNVKGTMTLDNKSKDVSVYVNQSQPNDIDEETELPYWLQGSEVSDGYITLRSGFFDAFKGRPLTIVSPLFNSIPVGYITELSYDIGEGEAEAAYTLTIREVESLDISSS